MRIVLLALTLVGLICPIASSSQPNILVIVSEDNGTELGCYGDPHARTPNLDTLAAQGVRFSRAYVAQPGCSQSRAAYLTGLYPHQNGQIGLATWGFRMYNKDTPNMVTCLKQQGYRTGIIGKLHVNPAEAFPFDFHEISTANFARKDLADYAKFAGKFINASSDPFFLSVNYPDAHAPWIKQVEGLPKVPLEASDVRPLPYFGVDTPQLRADMANHYNCMARLDALVGDLLTTLTVSGKRDNTLIIYFGDHGADFLRGKRTSYEGGIRVPLIVQWPDKMAAGQVRDELVSTVDLMPTLLAASGAQPVADLPGHSLLPLLQNQEIAWRRYLFTEYHTHAAIDNFFPQRTVCDARFKLIENLLPNQVNPGYAFTVHKKMADAHVAQAIESSNAEIRDAYRLMERPPRFELYDLKKDPHEFRNLTGERAHAKKLAELKAQLAAWRKQTADPLLNPEILQRLKTEVESIPSKKAGKKHDWAYPRYFFSDKREDR